MKKTMGLVISHKNNEKRRAILPEDVKRLRNPDMLFFLKPVTAILSDTRMRNTAWPVRM